MCAERGNPVGFRAMLPGGLTVRKVDLPAGQDGQEANAGAPKGDGKPGPMLCGSFGRKAPDNRPDTGRCPARKGADVAR